MKKITLILSSLFVFFNIYAQQDVYSRDDSGTGSWWHGNNPWYYSTWANNQNRPDNNSGTRNYVKIGHNNYTTMEVNGVWFQLNSLEFQAGASMNRTFNSVDAGAISLSNGIYNNSIGHHTFNVEVGIDASTVYFSANSGNLTFTNKVYLNANNLIVNGSNNTTISAIISGTGNFSKSGSGIVYISGNNSYSGATTVSAGVLELQSDLNSSSTITVQNGATLRINANDVDIQTLTIESGGTLEVSAGKSLNINGNLSNNGTITIKTGATVITNGTISGSGTTNVEQLLSSDRQWWYLSSPVSTAQTTIFNTNSNKIGYYDETIFNYTNPITATENLTIGRGYLVKLAGTTGGTYTFTGGSLNNGNITITPTRTGTANAKRGFNLIGNPYPSYIDWDAIYHDDTNPATNLRDAIWFRTYSSGMTFHTYSDGEAVPTSSGVTGKIAPMQGFWVKVHADGSNGSLTFKNAHRSHYAETGYNPLKAKANDDRQRVRLVLSDGTNTDETLIVAKSYASDNQDAYDIEKMSNESADISEIFSMIGTEAMVINSVAPITAGKTVTLGIRSTSEKAYSITASQLQNIPIDVRVILVDAGAETETELSEGVSYNFVASAGDVNNRFSIQFRSQGTTTQVDSDSKNQILAFSNSQQQIEIISTESLPAGTKICVFNTAGQTITQMLAAGTRIKIPATMSKGIYFCHIENATQNLQYKVIVR